MRIAHIAAVFFVASMASVGTQPRSETTGDSPGVILPIYRDLLNRRPFVEMNYVDRCGVGSGPIRILSADTPRAEAESIVRDLDAANVQRLAEQSLARAAAALPGATVTVCLFPGELSGGLPYLDGVGGVSLGGGRIKLLLHPKPGGLRRVSYTVAHEYHHEVERNLGGGGQRPIEIMIREGKADRFATALYPELRPPHTKPLTDAEFKQSWAAFLEYEERQASAAEFRADFMIGKNPSVLTWPGYRLGYEMVESYFKDKTLTPSAAITVPAQTILDHFRRHSSRAALTGSARAGVGGNAYFTGMASAT